MKNEITWWEDNKNKKNNKIFKTIKIRKQRR